jgi:hypothetical protein
MRGLASLGDISKLDADTNALVGPGLTGKTKAQQHQEEMIEACVKQGGKLSDCARSNPNQTRWEAQDPWRGVWCIRCHVERTWVGIYGKLCMAAP